MFQEVLLKEIRKVLSEDISLNEKIASVLDISYDAAHRRTSLKSKFSFEESVILAKYFDISLDSLIGLSHQEFVSVEKTKQISNETDLQNYFEKSYDSLVTLLNKDDCELIYSAKDIPLFYTLKDDVLSRFKMYVWQKMLNDSFRETSFENYHPKLDTLQAAKKLGSLYKDLSIIEIWDLTTINSTLKQIFFYYKAGHLTTDIALFLCSSLKELLNEIFQKIITKSQKFKFYHNELLLMNNNVLVLAPERKLLYVPFTMLSYFFTSDQQTCNEAKKYFDKQIKNSKLLNTSGESEQNSFFIRMFEKVDSLSKLIDIKTDMDF